ncbi:MAG: alpha/beta hydrolase fold domain-containing protein [Pirellulaceae bacterium]
MHESHHQPVPKSATPLTMRTPLRTLPWLLCSLLLGLAAAQAREQPATQSFIYKQTRQTELELIVHNPPDWKETDKRPAIVFFFGGGWTGGKIEQFEPQASHLARRGMVAVRADYRVKSRHRVTPKECVEDAKSAVRWIRQNESKELGHRAELFTAEGQPHGFFNRSPWLEKTTQRMDEFLASLSYLPPRENGAEFPVGQEDGRSFTIETNRPEDRVEIRREGDSATLVVFSQSGIGRATITTTSGNWPTTVIGVD